MGHIDRIKVGSATHLIEPTLYAKCETAAGTATKQTAAIDNFNLVTGVQVAVKFTATNTAAVSDLKLQIGTTTAKSIKYRGGNLPSIGTLAANHVYNFVYDGTNWELVGDLDTDTTTLPLTSITGTDDLRAIEGLTGTAGLLKKTAANTWTLDTTSYATAVNGGYLPRTGGEMTGTARISWADSGTWNDSSAEMPVKRGGLYWSGTSDWVELFAEETSRDGLNLVIDVGDDASPSLILRNKGTAKITLTPGSGVVSATSFSGSGASLTSLNASNISSGTLNTDRLATSGATAGSYGPSAAVSGSNGTTMNVPYITVDDKGRVTAISNKVYTAVNTWRPLGTGANDAAAGNHNHDGVYAPVVVGGYLPLSGGTMTGSINTYHPADSTTTTTPVITLRTNNKDVFLFQVGHATSVTGGFSNNYRLKYNGSLNTPNNYLELLANNGSGDTIAIQVNETGIVKFPGTFNYTGITTGDTAIARPIWFGAAIDSSTLDTGRPVYDNDFKYNPNSNTLTIGTGTLTATNYSGKAATAGTADSANAVAWSKVNDKPATATRWPAWSEVTGKPTSFTPASHTHDFLNSKGNVTAESGATKPTQKGLSMQNAYNNGYPTTYGNVLTMYGGGATQLFMGWSGSSTSSQGVHADAYIRSQRDTTETLWSDWAKLLDSDNYKTYTVSSIAGLQGDVTLAQLGLSSALRYQGTTTTAMEDGRTTAAVTIGGNSFTPTQGDVVIYNDAEYVWTGSLWELLGAESSFKKVQTAVNSSSASGNSATTFVSSVTQDTQGVITVKTSTLDTSGTWSGNATSATTATYLGNIGRLANMDVNFGSTAYNSKFFISYADGSTTTNKPYQNAMVLNIAWDNVSSNKYGAQIAIGNSSTPHLQLRGCYNGTWDTTWATVLDSSNYTTYAVAKTDGVTAVTWDATNKKLTRTINGTAADVMTATQMSTALGLGTMASETATNYLKWQTTSSASTALYNFGVYVAQNTAAGTGPNSSNYYNLINVPYRKASGNTKLDWGWQLGNTTSNDNRLYYRTTGDNTAGAWQTIVHVTTSANSTGSALQPVYINANGEATACTFKSLGDSNPNNFYSSTMTYTNSTAPTTDWYVQIELNRTWDGNLTNVVLKANYSNHVSTVYLNLNAHDGEWDCEHAVYGGATIKAIKAFMAGTELSRHLLIQACLAAPTAYNGSIPPGTITVYAPVDIVSITKLDTAPTDLITLRRGYNTTMNVVADKLYGTLEGNAITATSSKVLANLYGNYGIGQSPADRPDTANIAHVTNGGVTHFKVTSKTNATGKPMGDGNILHFYWDTSAAWNSQLYIPDSSGNSMQWRSSSAVGTWDSWRTLLDSNNYTTYALAWNEIKQSGADNLIEGSSNWTDNTEILTSYASNNGFADPNAKGKVYRRDAICAYNYIKGKTDSVYLKLDGTNTMTGTLNIKPASGEGGELHLCASTANTTEAGIVLDHLGNSLRIFGIASADGTTKTGTGTPLVIDPYAKTITGGYTITGNLNGDAVGKNEGWIAYPGGNTYHTTSANVTGALKITLPTVSKSTMMSFDVNIYTYDGDNATSTIYHISGYEYSTSGWHDPVCRVYSEGIGNYTNLTVRFGSENDKAYVTIGEINTVWRYPQVAISNILLGYQNYNFATWGSDWSITFVTALPSSSTGSRTTVNTQSINITGNAATATTATYLRTSTRMDYGWTGINYYQISAANQSAAKVNDTPYSTATWTHILRFNHGNTAGYYTDLAIPFNGNSIYFKRIANGTLQNSTTNGGWVKVLDQLNYSSYALPLGGGTMTGTITLHTTGLKTAWDAGYITDEYGNFKHQRATTSDTWQLVSNAGAANFKYAWETGNITTVGTVTAAGFSGPLSGNATSATVVGKGTHTAAVTANEFSSILSAGTMTIVGNVSNTSMPKTNNANAELIIKTHPTSESNYYEARLGFSSNGALYYMPVNATTWQRIAYQTALSDYLPLAGGNMTGKIYSSAARKLQWTTSDNDNNSDGASWYGLGGFDVEETSGSSTVTRQWICLSNYWGLSFRARDDNHIKINGSIVLNATNYSSYALPLSGGTMTGDIKGNQTVALGTTANPFHNIVLGGETTATMTAASTNPRITFQSSNNGTQQVHLIYSNFDNYRAPAGLKIIGENTSGDMASPAWLEVEGNIYAAAFKGNADTATRLAPSSITSLSSFTHNTDLIYTVQGGSNSIADKPADVDAFGVLSLKTANGWYGQLLMSSDSAPGLYWRTATSLSGGWNKILDSANYDTYALPLTGGQISGQITKEGVGKNWNKGRDGALIALTSLTSYSILASIKTVNGSWDIGSYTDTNYTDDLLFTYISDTHYNGSNNVDAQIRFLENGHIIAALDGTASKANLLNSSSAANTTGLQYYSGQPTIGSADGNAYDGSSSNYKLWSYPADYTGHTTVANIQTIRMYWGQTYFHDIFASPNNENLLHRSVLSGSAKGWRLILDSANYNDYVAAKSHTHPITDITWAGNKNFTASATANNQEWSLDLTPGSYTGTYWHVWSSKNSKTILACYTDDNSVQIPNGDLTVGGSTSLGGQTTINYTTPASSAKGSSQLQICDSSTSAPVAAIELRRGAINNQNGKASWQIINDRALRFAVDYSDNAASQATTYNHTILTLDYNNPIGISVNGGGNFTGNLTASGLTASGQILTSFKNSVAIGSYGSAKGTIPNLLEEVRYSSGCMGSFSLTTAYTLNNITLPTGWYNFMYIPHRSGGLNGAASGDNCDYGALYLHRMNATGYADYVLSYASEAAKLLDLHASFQSAVTGGEIVVADGTLGHIKTSGYTVSSFATTDHTHNYAGSSSAGGSATSAVKLDGGLATNDISTYTNLKLTTAKGGYYGFLVGDSTSCMNVMGAAQHNGLYCQAHGRWITYYDATNDRIAIGSATTKSGYVLAISGKTHINDATTVNGTISAATITLTNTGATSHIDFSRTGGHNSPNYINVPASSALAVSVGGAAGANIAVMIENKSVNSFNDAETSLGTSTHEWKETYSKNYVVGKKVKLEYNSTDESLDFIFI